MQNERYIIGKNHTPTMYHVFYKVLRKEGVLALWKGFTPFYFSIFSFYLSSAFILNHFCFLREDDKCSLDSDDLE